MNNEERVKRVAEIAVKECGRNPNAHSVEECIKCQFHPRSCNQWQLAEKLIDEGYHKTVWHKVTENDLPQKQGQKVWLCTINRDYFMANYWDDTEVGGKQFFEVASACRITLSNVLAWAELPKYEE